MSLHPGERGVCSLHGVFDEYCSECIDEQTGRSTKRIEDNYTKAVVLDKNVKFKRLPAGELV